MCSVVERTAFSCFYSCFLVFFFLWFRILLSLKKISSVLHFSSLCSLELTLIISNTCRPRSGDVLRPQIRRKSASFTERGSSCRGGGGGRIGTADQLDVELFRSVRRSKNLEVLFARFFLNAKVFFCSREWAMRCPAFVSFPARSFLLDLSFNTP